jgi:hypothetical protein
VYDLVDRVNQLPMKVSVDLDLKGVTFCLSLKTRIPEILVGCLHAVGDHKELKEQQAVKMVIPKSTKLKEPLSVNLKVSELTVDYVPLLNSDQFGQIFERKARKDSGDKRRDGAKQEFFKTALRVIVALDDLEVVIDEVNEVKEVEMSELSFNLLDNNDFTEQTNPILFTDPT